MDMTPERVGMSRVAQLVYLMSQRDTHQRRAETLSREIDRIAAQRDDDEE